MHDAMETLPLLSADQKNELPCHVVADVDIEGVRYVLVTPKDTLVTVVRDDDDGVVELELDALPPLLPMINAELRTHGLSVEVQTGELVLHGQLGDELSDLCDTIGISEDGEEDGHLILADVEHEGARYLLLSPELPELFAAKVQDGKALPLSDRELARVEDRLEAALGEQTH